MVDVERGAEGLVGVACVVRCQFSEEVECGLPGCWWCVSCRYTPFQVTLNGTAKRVWGRKLDVKVGGAGLFTVGCGVHVNGYSMPIVYEVELHGCGTAVSE